MADDKTLSDVLLLLTKVSSKLADKVDKLEKLVGNNLKRKKTEETDKEDKKESRKKSKKDDDLSTLTKMLKMQIESQTKKPEEVVEKRQEVIVTSFGRSAKKTLTEMFGLAPREKEDKTPVPQYKEPTLLDKLKSFLPIIGLGIGALAGLFSALMSGKFGEFWEKIKEGDFSGAFDKAKSIIYDAVSPILKSLPIIGPILSIRDGIEQFDKGNVIGGIKNLVQGIIGLTPLPIPVKSAIIGAVEMLGSLLQNKYGDQQIPEGSGGDIMAGAMKAVGLVLKPLIKRIPLVGSLISFYEAYEAFQAGGPAGITKGILNLAAGVANLLPGYGTAIAIGLDIISAFVFTEKEEMVDGKKVKKIDTRDWFKKTVDFITNSFPLKNLIMFGEGIGDIINGDYREGFTKMADAIPVFGFFMDMARALGSESVKAQQKGGSMTDFLEAVINSILIAIVKMLPESFGIRYAAQKLLGVDAGVNKPQKVLDAEAEEAKLTPAQRAVQEEAERRKKQEEAANEEKNRLGKNAMMGQPVRDFIKTNDGKLIIPDKEDSLIGFKKDGPLDVMFNKNLKTSQENNTILKKYAEVSSDVLNKQLKLLDDNNKLLNAIAKNLSTPTNVVSKPTVITNNFTSGVSLRGMQGAPA